MSEIRTKIVLKTLLFLKQKRDKKNSSVVDFHKIQNSLLFFPKKLLF